MWQKITDLANLFQIISMLLFFWGAFVFFTRSRRYKKIIREAQSVKTAKPMALIISVSGTDITPQVLHFLHSQDMEMRTFSYVKTDGIIRENIPHRLSDILKIKDEMSAAGATEVHLFIMAPLAFGVAVGAILDNWVRVNVYHLNREKNSYEYWTYLHKGFVPGLGYSAAQELANE